MRDLDRIQEVSEYRVTGPQLGSLAVLILLLVAGSGLAGYQTGILNGDVDEDLLKPAEAAQPGGEAVLADMLADRESSDSSTTESGEGDGLEGVPPRIKPPALGSSLSDPNPDLEDTSSPKEADAATKTTPPPATATTPPVETKTPPVVKVEAPPVKKDEPTAQKSPSSSPSGKGFTVQLAAYPSSKEADELVASLRAAGFGDAFHQEAKVGGRTWFRVRVGLYQSRAEAESAAGRLTGVSPYDPYITSHP